MRMLLMAVLCFLAFVLGIGSRGYEQTGVYQVLKGRVSLAGSEPLIDVLITDKTGNSYIVHGPLRNELFRLSGMTVRAVGAVLDAPALPIKGRISVERYILVDPGYPPGTAWAIGVLREDDHGLLLVGDDLCLYRIIEPEPLQRYLGRRMVLIGTIIELDEYQMELKLEGYKPVSD